MVTVHTSWASHSTHLAVPLSRCVNLPAYIQRTGQLRLGCILLSMFNNALTGQVWVSTTPQYGGRAPVASFS